MRFSIVMGVYGRRRVHSMEEVFYVLILLTYILVSFVRINFNIYNRAFADV